MGNLPSREIRNERRNSRRLSKPQTNTSSFNLLKSGSFKRHTDTSDGPVLSDNSMIWKSPWTGDLLPKASPAIDESDRLRVRSLPSFAALHSAPSRPSISDSRRWSNFEETRGGIHEHTLSHSTSFVSRRLTRRPSTVQPAGTKSGSRQPPYREAQRPPSFYLAPSEIVDDVQVTPMEETVTAMIEDHGLSLIRRKSFLKPGVATRGSQDFYRRPVAVIEQEDESVRCYPTLASRSSRWPLYESDQLSEEYPAPPVMYGRSSSPIALDYSHLGGLKRGSLRIMNGSVSPAPSDRTGRFMPAHSNRQSGGDGHSFEISKRSTRTSADVINGIPPFEPSAAQYTPFPDHSDHWAAGNSSASSLAPAPAYVSLHGRIDTQTRTDSEGAMKQTWKKRAASLLEITLNRQTSHTEGEHDIPGSPFSFEKSPTTVTAPRQIPFFSEDGMEDEAINLTLDESVPDNGSVGKGLDASGMGTPDSIRKLGRRKSRSLTNADSGYSSVSSVYSEGTDRTSRSPNLSESPPQHVSLTASKEAMDNFAREHVENCRRRPRRLSLRRQSKEVDILSTEQPQKSPPPLLTISTMCRESGNKKVRDRNSPHGPHHRRRSSSGRNAPTRFYTQPGPSSVPSIPPLTSIQDTDSDIGESSEEAEIELSVRERRFSTSQLRLGLRRNGFIESGTTYRSGGEDFIIENTSRRPETESYGDPQVDRSADARMRHVKPKSAASEGSKVRSLSEPRMKARQSRENEGGNNWSQYPFHRRQQQQQSAKIPDHDIPPVPSLPSMFIVHQKVQGMRLSDRIEEDEGLRRGRTQTRSIDQSRKKGMKLQRGFPQHLSQLNK
jgi:hypothetical protein